MSSKLKSRINFGDYWGMTRFQMLAIYLGGPLAASCLSACVEVPPLDGPANIPTTAIVERVKCNLVDAIKDLESRDKQRFVS